MLCSSTRVNEFFSIFGYFIRFRKDVQELGCYKIIFLLRGKQTRRAEVQPAEMRSGGNQCPVVEQ